MQKAVYAAENRDGRGEVLALLFSWPVCHCVQVTSPLLASVFLVLRRRELASMNNPALFKAGRVLIVEVCALSCQKETPCHSDARGISAPGNKGEGVQTAGSKGPGGDHSVF